MTHERLESKLGFDKIRKMIADRCLTDYAAGRVAEEGFSTDPVIIRQRLALADEMRLVLMFEENFPTTGYIDAIPFLSALERTGIEKLRNDLYKMVAEIHAGRYPFNNFLW